VDKPDERPRKWHDTPGAGRPELRWRIVRGFTLGFSVVTVVLCLGYGLFVAAILVAFATGTASFGSNK
jgi:hypothetical protein